MAIVSHTGYNMFIRTDCDFPWLYNAITFYYTWSMLFLFLHFYYTTYVASKSRRARQKVAAEPAAPASPKEISQAAPGDESPSETKSSYINGYVADGPSGYSLRARKNGSINGNASTVLDGSL